MTGRAAATALALGLGLGLALAAPMLARAEPPKPHVDLRVADDEATRVALSIEGTRGALRFGPFTVSLAVRPTWRTRHAVATWITLGFAADF